MDYHSSKFEDFSFLFFKNNKLIGLFPANIVDDQAISHQGLTYGGFILKDFSKFNDVFSMTDLLLKELKGLDIKSLILKKIPNIYSSLPSDEINYLLFKLNAKLIKTELLSVLKIGFKNFSKDRIQGIKRGFKSNLLVKEVNSFDEFWNKLLITNLIQKHNTKPVHTLNEISNLKNSFKHNIRQFNVYFKDNLVAGATIFETKTTAHVQYIASNTLKNELGSLDFLFDHLINKVFNNKNYFDFGNSNEENGNKLNQGLLYWKEGFGARCITQEFYQINTSSFRNLENLYI